MTIAMVVLFAATAATNANAVTRTPTRCAHRTAPTLCAIHFHRGRANKMRVRIGMRPVPYHWTAERHPARRARILTYWMHVQARAAKRLRAWLRAPWLVGSFHTNAMCIHRHESRNWHDPGSPGGGMQFEQGTWDNRVVKGYEFAATPGRASPRDQLHAAWRLVRHDGNWHEWSTAPLCGL